MKISNQKSELTELHAQKEHEKKLVLVGSKRLRPGHTCFEINVKTLECKAAKFEKEVYLHAPSKRKIIIKDGYAYVNALNIKNAIKVYKRDIAP